MTDSNKYKAFYYSMPELSIKNKFIMLYDKQCQTLDDLKKIISSELYIPDHLLKFTNPPKAELKDLKDRYEFTLSFSSPHPDIDILIPDGKIIKVKDCYKMKFEQIIEYLGKQGYYYSQQCIKNQLRISFSGIEISREGYPFLSLNESAKLELKLFGKTVELNYCGNIFTFSENESFYEAKKLFEKVYPSCKLSISNVNGNYSSRLISTEQYRIKAEAYIKIVDIDDAYSSKYINIELNDTILNMKKQLAEKLKYNFENINLNKLKIYDFNKAEITDLNGRVFGYINSVKNLYYKYEGKTPFTSPKSYKSSEKEKPSFLTKPKQDDDDISYKKNIKKFYFSISNLSYDLDFITVSNDECKTVDDIKKRISSKLHISDQKVKILNPSKHDFDEYYIFKIEISGPHPDIDILMPNGKKILIKDCYAMKFNDIISFLENEGYYFSQPCIKKNFHLYCKGKEISKEGNPFLSFTKASTLEFKLLGDFVTIKYGETQFSFSENDSSFEAEFLIKKAFPNCIVTIKNNDSKYIKYITSKEKYDIKIESVVMITNINTDYSDFINLDYNETIFDLRKKLSDKLKYRFGKSNPKDFIIFDSNKNEIKDLNQPLIRFKNTGAKFYYKNVNEKKHSYYSYYSESNSEIESLKQIINEQKEQINQQKSRINELEKLLEESNKKKTSTKHNDSSIQILSIDQISNLERMKELQNNQSEAVYEVCQTEIIKQNFVLKVMKDVNYENLQSFIREHETLRIFDHPNILKTYGIFLSDEENPPSILLEHFTDNLEDVIKKKKLNNVDTLSIAFQIAEGMKYVHFNNVIHRNLCPKCILISNDNVIKIGEFGISKLFSPHEQLTLSMNGIIGSMKYMAPEMIEDEKYDEKVDVFSFGILCLYLLNGGKISMKKRKSKKDEIEIPSSFTSYCKELINQCTILDPKERPNFEKICNDFVEYYDKIIELTKEEKQEIKVFIEQHKEKIPKYSH